MKDEEKKDFFDAMKHGHLWHIKKITGHLHDMLTKPESPYQWDHEIRQDRNEDLLFILDNNCYLFIYDDLIELRSDRENVPSSHQTIKYQIKSANDIVAAYKHFVDLTREDEEL